MLTNKIYKSSMVEKFTTFSGIEKVLSDGTEKLLISAVAEAARELGPKASSFDHVTLSKDERNYSWASWTAESDTFIYVVHITGIGNDEVDTCYFNVTETVTSKCQSADGMLNMYFTFDRYKSLYKNCEHTQALKSNKQNGTEYDTFVHHTMLCGKISR